MFSVVMSPVDLYASSMVSLLTVYFLGRLCAPRCSQLNMTQENMILLGYCAGLAVAGYNIPDAHADWGVALIAAIVLDYNATTCWGWGTRKTLPPIWRS